MTNQLIYAYLRASTKEQDAQRSKDSLDEFAESRSLRIARYYIENESGSVLERSELMRMINDAKTGDIILIESVDRLTRLTYEKWQLLKNQLNSKQLKIVVVDIPTTHQLIENNDDLTKSIITIINNMLIDVLASVAHYDYKTRRKRQREGIEKAKREGRYKGRRPNLEKHRQIIRMLNSGFSYSEIAKTLKVSKATVSRVFQKNQDQVERK